MDLEAQMKLEANKAIGERCKVDLFYLAKYVLGGGDLLDPRVHGPLTASMRHLIFKDNPEKSLRYEFPSDYGRSEEEGLPTEEEKEEFRKWEAQFEPNVDAAYTVRDKIDINLTSHLYLMPRGTLKTSIITIAGTIQWLLNYPNDRVAIDSETVTKAQGFLTEIKGHFEENEKLRDIWHALYGHYPDRDAKKKKWSTEGLVLATRERSRKEPSIDAIGPGVARNGWHYDIAFLDDLHSELNTKTKEEIDKVKEHRKLVYSLLDPGAPQVVVGTRWSFADMYQEIIEEEYEDFNFITRAAMSPNGEEFYPKRLSRPVLNRFRRIQGAYLFSCTPGDGKIWMADGTYKPIRDVEIGEYVIGFEKSKSGRIRLKKSKVISKDSRSAMVNKIYLSSGDVVRSTADHKWYTGREPSEKEPWRKMYRPVEVGSKMMRMAFSEDRELSVQDRIDYAYIAGIIDGEGACKHGSIQIIQSEYHNAPVCRKIEEALDRLKIPYSTHKSRREGKTACTAYTLNGGRKTAIEVVKYGKPAKSYQIMDVVMKHSARTVLSKDRVLKIEQDKLEMVYALGTETGNYVSQSYGSSNCQYMNNPVDDDTATFKRENFKYMSRQAMHEKKINWYGLVDPSYEGPYSDYCAIVIAGMDSQGNIYVKHVVREKMTYKGIIDKMFELEAIFKPVRWGMEVVGTQKSIEYTLRQEERERGKSLRCHLFKGQRKKKEERIRGLAPYFESGRVYFCQGMPNLNHLMDELLKFPRAKNDDVSDCLANILEIGVRASKSLTEQQQKTSVNSKDYITMLNKPRSPMVGY